MQSFKIIIEKAAKKDIQQLYSYIAENDLIEKAQFFKELLREKIQSLSSMPERGHRLRQMEKYNLFELYEIFFHSYRIIYTVTKNTVTIHGVIDCRREFEKVLLKRFLIWQ